MSSVQSGARTQAGAAIASMTVASANAPWPARTASRPAVPFLVKTRLNPEPSGCCRATKRRSAGEARQSNRLW